MERYRSLFDPSAQQRLREDVQGSVFRFVATGIDLYRTGKNSLRLYIGKGSIETGLSNSDQDAMYVLHGEHARTLGDKSRFPGLVRELGYKAPENYLLKTDKTPPEDRAGEVLTYYQNPARQAEGKAITLLFVKPLNGTWQRDLAAFDTTTQEGKEDLKKYLAEVEEYTLIQEFMPNNGNFRYMSYRSNGGAIYTACSKFARDKSADFKVKLPFIGKRIHSKATGVNNNKYLETIINLASIPLDNNNNQLDNLNKFMNGFTNALEARLGGKLPLLSMDIGISDVEKLGGKYDEEVMRENVIFFETQTLPLPWEFKQHNISHPLGTYINLWKMFLKEHGDEIIERAKNLRNSYNQRLKARQ